jgi:DNA-binding beta-propeller fold protein YncE
MKKPVVPVSLSGRHPAVDDPFGHRIWPEVGVVNVTTGADPTITLHGTPSAIALGRGMVWIANRDRNTVSRLDARTGVPTGRAVAVGPSTTALALGFRSLWVADESAASSTRRSKRQTVIDTISVGNGPVDLAVGNGSVWVANNLDGTVSRINPARGVMVGTISVGDGPALLLRRPTASVGNQFDGTLALISRLRTPSREGCTSDSNRSVSPPGERLFVAVRAAGAPTAAAPSARSRRGQGPAPSTRSITAPRRRRS